MSRPVMLGSVRPWHRPSRGHIGRAASGGSHADDAKSFGALWSEPSPRGPGWPESGLDLNVLTLDLMISLQNLSFVPSKFRAGLARALLRDRNGHATTIRKMS